jgi:hypothetical protein
MSAKAEHELVVFTEFAQVSGLTVCAGSIETREPPQPDIWCMLGNKPYFFELGRVLSSKQPRLRLEALRCYPDQVQIDPLRFGFPERDMLRGKLLKTYETNGVPIDLVLYYDWGPDAFLTASAPFMEEAEFFDGVFQPELVSVRGPFTTIWIYERYRPSGSVLWRYPAPQSSPQTGRAEK